MATRKSLNKNSAYVQSLVDFILDTKPYHSKLTQVIEEYHFFDDVNVKIEEKFINRAKLDSNWLYNFYSSASLTQRVMPFQRVVDPAFTTHALKVGVDENTDMPMVPFVYSKKSMDHIGPNSVYIGRARGTTDVLTESVDYFTSHGSFQFQIKQTLDASGNFAPLWTSSNDEGIISAARATTRAQALDEENPGSSLNRLKALMAEIRAAYPVHQDVLDEVEKIEEILAVPDLPQTYEDLFATMGTHAEVQYDIEEAKFLVQKLSSPLYFGIYSDMGLRESGLADYRDVSDASIRIFDIVPNHDIGYEEWTVTAVEPELNTWKIEGSSSGFVGFIVSGEAFTANSKIAFKTERLGVPPEAGQSVSFRPIRKINIHKSAPLETWNLIKVNSIAHTASRYVSTHYGIIVDTAGVQGNITIVDQTLPSTTIVLDAREGGKVFDLTNSATPQHQGVVYVDEPYNDGLVAFTVKEGAGKFRFGDRFVIKIVNELPFPENFQIGYGYDLDPYDNDHIVYNNTDPDSPNYNKPIGFYYDGRFTDFDISALNLEISQAIIDKRQFRLRALPSDEPIATLKKDGSGPNNMVDIYDATTGEAPDPELTSLPVYSMPGDTNPAPDLLLYYANEFALEYSDDGFQTVNFVANVPVGGDFDSPQLGIKFNLPHASKPFISSSSDNGVGQPRVIGGDIISFRIENPLPYVDDRPIRFFSPWVPRLILHSDSFYDAPAAKWKVYLDSDISWTLTGTVGDDVTYGPVTGRIPTNGQVPNENYSFQGLGVHFTIVPRDGIFAGDEFTFETFERKPSYLVHGSVTGWTAPAVIGEYYWNGKIGFTITKPEWAVYIDNNQVDPAANGFTLERLRDDTPSLTYILEKTVNDGYMVTRSDIGVQGYVSQSGTYTDKYVKFTLNLATANGFKLDVNGNDFPLFRAHDTIILNPDPALFPADGDTVYIEKTEAGNVQVSITTTTADTSGLKPISIDPRFVDFDTKNSLYPLSITSPETQVMNGWLPLYDVKKDSSSSVAEFSDAVTRHELYSAATGEHVANIRQNSANPNEPIVLEWVTSFYQKYMPLNTEVNVTTMGTGWNDRTSVNMTESIKFLIGGGALLENWLFNDVVNIHMDEETMMSIASEYADEFATVITDNHRGFMPGFGNLGYDAEAGGYDEGRAPDLYSVLANVTLTQAQREDYIKQWDFYINSQPNPPSTEEQWTYLYMMLQDDPNPGTVTDDFGLPTTGLGLDVTDESTDGAGTRFMEAVITAATDFPNLHDERGYDVGPLDSQDNQTAYLLSPLPPVPSTIPEGSTYDSLDTPLAVGIPSRTFEVLFNGSTEQLAALSPTFRIWFPGESSPHTVAVVRKLAAGRYQFTIPSPSEVKLIVG